MTTKYFIKHQDGKSLLTYDIDVSNHLYYNTWADLEGSDLWLFEQEE